MAVIEKMVETPVKVRVCDFCKEPGKPDDYVLKTTVFLGRLNTSLGIAVVVDSESGQVDLHKGCAAAIRARLNHALEGNNA